MEHSKQQKGADKLRAHAVKAVDLVDYQERFCGEQDNN